MYQHFQRRSIKIGLLGTGLIAREHAEAISRTPGLTLVAAADVLPERLIAFGDVFKIPRCYGSGAELIGDSTVDLVAIATPPAFHEEAAVGALKAGKYVFCEKPLAHNMVSAVRIAEAERRHPGRLSTSYQLRYEASLRRLVWLCRNGYLGEIESARVERHGSIPHADAGAGGWWGSWQVAGGGVLITQLIHELDLILLIMGLPVSVRAEMDTRFTGIESEDWVEAELRFANGAVASFAASVNSGQIGGSITIKGSLGTASPGSLALNDPQWQARALKAVDAALPDTRPPSSFLPRRVLRKLARDLGLAKPRELSAHAHLYHDIAQCIGRESPLPIPPADALKSLEVCAAAYESALSGRTVAWPVSPSALAYNGMSKAAYNARPLPRRTIQRGNAGQGRGNVIRIGLIGLDTSHAPTFADLLHNPYNPEHIPGAKVVAAYPGGSPDMAISISRVAGFTAQLREVYGVPIVESPRAVAEACDVVFILAADGRTHPGLVRAAAAGKPIFLDKPFAVSTGDAETIFATARDAGVKIFGSSAFRYADGLIAALTEIRKRGERIRSCEIRYYLQIEPTQGRYFWYGIHAAEMLSAIMGTGVSEVEALSAGRRDTITVGYRDGRFATLVGSQTDESFAARIETERRTIAIDLTPSMGSSAARLLASVLDVLTEGHYPRLWRASPIGSVCARAGNEFDPNEADTTEIIRVLEAGQTSFRSQSKTRLSAAPNQLGAQLIAG